MVVGLLLPVLRRAARSQRCGQVAHRVAEGFTDRVVRSARAVILSPLRPGIGEERPLTSPQTSSARESEVAPSRRPLLAKSSLVEPVQNSLRTHLAFPMLASVCAHAATWLNEQFLRFALGALWWWTRMDDQSDFGLV